MLQLKDNRTQKEKEQRTVADFDLHQFRNIQMQLDQFET